MQKPNLLLLRLKELVMYISIWKGVCNTNDMWHVVYCVLHWSETTINPNWIIENYNGVIFKILMNSLVYEYLFITFIPRFIAASIKFLNFI